MGKWQVLISSTGLIITQFVHEIVFHIREVFIKSLISFNFQTEVQDLPVCFGISIEGWT